VELDFAHFVLFDKGFELFSETAQLVNKGKSREKLGLGSSSLQLVFLHFAGGSIRKFAIAYNLLNIAHHSF
jgi:hypothetical protein